MNNNNWQREFGRRFAADVEASLPLWMALILVLVIGYGIWYAKPVAQEGVVVGIGMTDGRAPYSQTMMVRFSDGVLYYYHLDEVASLGEFPSSGTRVLAPRNRLPTTRGVRLDAFFEERWGPPTETGEEPRAFQPDDFVTL